MSRGFLAVLVALAACGDDGDVHHLADAPPAADAAIDAPTSGPVTITISFQGTPREGIDVYFLAADGSLVAKVPTSAQGVATATMMAGGSVTVVNPFPLKGGTELKTIGGVKPGDQLVLTQSLGADGVQVALTVPDDPAATQYDVFTTCGFQQQLQPGGGSGAPATGTLLLSGCTGNLADLLVVTLDALGNPSKYLYKPGVTVTDQGTLDFRTETYAGQVPLATLTWMNPPAGATDIRFHDVVFTSRGPLLDTDQTTSIAAPGAVATIARPMTSVGARAVTSSHPEPTNGIGGHYVVDWGPAEPTATFDLAGALLGTLAAVPTVDPATRRVTWTAGAGATPDLAWATLSGFRTDGTTSQSWRWEIAMPYAGASVTLPKLPADLDTYNFAAGDTIDVSSLTLAKVPGGYDAVRAHLLSNLSLEGLAAGASGRIVYELLERPLARRAQR